MRAQIRTLVVAMLLITTVGCSHWLAPVKSPAVANYALSAVPTAVKRARTTRGSLLVLRPTASAGYQSANMIYSEQAYHLQTFTKHSWVAPPADMLLPLLVKSIARTHGFETVVAAPFAGTTNFTLMTNLDQLEQNFTTRPSQMQIAFTATLLDNTTNKIVSSHIFHASVPAGHTPYAGVVAANAAVQQLLTELDQTLIE